MTSIRSRANAINSPERFRNVTGSAGKTHIGRLIIGFARGTKKQRHNAAGLLDQHRSEALSRSSITETSLRNYRQGRIVGSRSRNLCSDHASCPLPTHHIRAGASLRMRLALLLASLSAQARQVVGGSKNELKFYWDSLNRIVRHLTI